jgi:hypothetical protein
MFKIRSRNNVFALCTYAIRWVSVIPESVSVEVVDAVRMTMKR